MTGAHTTHYKFTMIGATCVTSFAGLLKLFRRFSYLKEFLSTVGEPGRGAPVDCTSAGADPSFIEKV